jgi:PPOX class probable F420-dependent enzyme
MTTGAEMTIAERAFLAAARRAVLVTVAPDGRPRPVPVCFVLDPVEPILVTPIDEKPKRVDDPLSLARVRDIETDARVAVLVDRWDEDWRRLAWLRGIGSAVVTPPSATDHAAIVAALRAKYPPYTGHRLEVRPLIRVTLERATSWGAISRLLPDEVK